VLPDRRRALFHSIIEVNRLLLLPFGEDLLPFVDRCQIVDLGYGGRPWWCCQLQNLILVCLDWQIEQNLTPCSMSHPRMRLNVVGLLLSYSLRSFRENSHFGAFGRILTWTMVTFFLVNLHFPVNCPVDGCTMYYVVLCCSTEKVEFSKTVVPCCYFLLWIITLRVEINNFDISVT
jgi:hypothetical protein